jgi:RHS repeat-associated protein
MERNAHHSSRFMVAFLLSLFISMHSAAQTYIAPSAILTTTLSAGSYYNNNSITLNPDFSFVAGSGSNLSMYIVAPDCVPQTISLSANQNYILTSVPQVGGMKNAGAGINTGDFANRTTCELMQSVQYFDGLGRPLQSVQVKGSPLKKDIVQPFAYDQFGREVMKYLPYAATTIDGSYKGDAFTGALTNFYNPGNTSATQQTNGMPNTSFPFAQTAFEASPLNRVIEQGAPGTAWQLGTTPDAASNSHSVRAVFTTNDQTGFNTANVTTNNGARIVALYTATINSNQSRTLGRVSNIATYGNNQFFVTITRNENWQPSDGCFNTIEEYKDKEGHIILKRAYNIKVTGTTTSPVKTAELLSTFYVYDDLGNLCFVLPPGANPDAQAAISQATLDNRCYQYRYDARNRLVQKKIPGKGWEYIIYNKLDQPVATQDSVQRMKSPQEWTITKYDAMGRVVLTGIYQNGATPGTDIHGTIQGLADGQTAQWETPVSTGNGYTTNTWPASWTTTLSVNYYDSYTGIPNFPSAYDQTGNTAYSKQATGLLTASKTLVLNTAGDYLWSVPYYDSEGKVIRTFSQHYVGGNTAMSQYNYDDIQTTYNFVKQPTVVKRLHYLKNTGGTAGVLTLTETNTYAYDHMGRRQSTTHQLQDGSNAAQQEVILARSDYNEVGQLKTKRLHSVNSGTNYLQTIDYRYNPRGWLSSINNASLNNDGGLTNNDTNDKFGEELSYDGTTTAAKQYGGNIATAVWKSGPYTAGTLVTPVKQTYDYGYDNLNRLRSAVSTSSATAKDNLYGENVTYDNMGNITGLGRFDNISGKTQIDTLTYTYNHYKVTQVDDASAYAGTAGFQDPVKQANEYTYDGNGNELKDLNKGISSITYNLLNLPQTITKTDGTTVTYVYNATGNKLRKLLTTGGITTITEYDNGIQYDNSTSTIAFIQTEEGRARKSGSNYVYEYDLKDHLGNTRVTLTPDPTDGTQQTAKIVQENDYYAFGYGIQSTQQTISPKNEYLYNHKELQEETGLYDYGARFYDPVIGRWESVDPLVEDDQESASPYGYVFDDPIKNTDPDGRYPNGPGDEFVEGVKEGFVGYFTGIAHAVTNPGETIKNTFSAEGFKNTFLNGATMGMYGQIKGAYNLSVAASNGDFKAVGNAVGDKAAEATVVVATEGALKGFNAVKGLIKDADAIKLDVPGGPKTGSQGGPGASKPFSPKIRAESKAEANGNCVFCGDKTDTGAPGKKGNTDHAIPKSRNGNNTIENAQHTCAHCNQVLKRTMTTTEYLKQKRN